MPRTKKTPAQYLGQMAEFASRLQAASLDHAAWAADKRYVRINGGGLRVVSLCANSPCGSLDGYGTRKTTKGLNDQEARQAKIPECEPKSKPEHLWQAALIEHSLRWPDALPRLLHLHDACDELRFVTDELSLDVIRADVVLLGCSGSTWFPVFVELKVQRNETRLLDQLTGISKITNLDEATSSGFKEFVATAARAYGAKIAGKVDLDRALKVMIWPSTSGTPRSGERVKELNVRVLEFPKGSRPRERFDAPSLPLTPITKT